MASGLALTLCLFDDYSKYYFSKLPFYSHFGSNEHLILAYIVGSIC